MRLPAIGDVRWIAQKAQHAYRVLNDPLGFSVCTVIGHSREWRTVTRAGCARCPATYDPINGWSK